MQPNNMEFIVTILIFIIGSSCLGIGYGQTSFDVTNYGAIGDGITDDSQAFLKAWKDLCKTEEEDPTLIVPNKTFLLQPLNFQGPCHSIKLHFQISGKIVAPKTIEAWKNCESGVWISFKNVDGLIMDGSGVIDGQGAAWWGKVRSNGLYGMKNSTCGHRPKALSFHSCNDLEMSGIKHLNSPGAHISINSCKGVNIHDVQIIAPERSPNTDGIDISSATNIRIHDSFIGTGDDCVAINSGTSFINISNILCGPGHGISVGSLGHNGGYAKVEEVHVKNCTFNGTQNGARIKTWQGGSGYARKISFDDIRLINCRNPIIIDQHYMSLQENEGVKISDVTYNRIRGTSENEDAIKLDCSKSSICTGIVMDEINITSSVPGKKTKALCNNVVGTSISTSPSVSCLS